MTTLGEYLHDLTLEALTACTERQRTAYQLVHGITGTGLHAEPCTITEAARIINAPRQNVTNDLAHARAAVYEKIAKHLILKLTIDADEGIETPVPGVPTSLSPDETRYFLHATVRTEQRVNLGPGSQAMESAGKHSDLTRRRSATIDVHQRYALGGLA